MDGCTIDFTRKMDSSLAQLKDEFQKLTGFRFPENVRMLATEAIQAINKHDFAIPIDSSELSVVRTITTIFMNPKLAKSSVLIVPVVLDCIQANIFGPACLEKVVGGIVSIAPELDDESSFRLLQHTSAGLIINFPHLNIIQAYFSLVIAMITHKNVVISSAAFASFPQMLSTLDDTIKNAPKDSKEIKEYAEEYSQKFGSQFTQFENNLHFIFFLLFSDLCAIALDQPIQWLHVTKPPTSIIYDLLEVALNTCKDLLQDVPILLGLFEGTVIQGTNEQIALQYVVCFIETFMESHVSLCSSLFTDFLTRISPKSRYNHVPLFFFNSIALRSPTFAYRFYNLCDRDLEIFNNLIKTLLTFSDPNAPTRPIVFCLKSPKLAQLSNEKGQNQITLASAYEICFGILRSFSTEQNEKIGKFLEVSTKPLISILTSALKYSSPSTFNMATDAFRDLLQLLHKYSLVDLEKELFEYLCNYNITKNEFSASEAKTFSIPEKVGLLSEFLCSLLKQCADECNTCSWLTILRSVFKSKSMPSPDFANELLDEYVNNIFIALLQLEPIPFEFITNAILSLSTKFDVIWETLKSSFSSADPANYDSNLLQLFLAILSKCVTKENEKRILSTTSELVSPQSELPLKTRKKIMKKLRKTFAESAEKIGEGWEDVFKILSPTNFENDANIVQASFSLLNLICNDYFNLISEKFLQNCIDLIFQFSDETADINISLSSFDLLWNVVRIMENNSVSWKSLMQEVMRHIRDSRSDVSQCAIRTFFNLMSSNYTQIPEDVIEFLVSSGFMELLNGFDENNQEKAPELELSLQELAHYSATFWNQFQKYSPFKTEFLPFLIQKQTSFSIKCENQELVTNGFQFYECLFQCEHLDQETENLLRDSISTLTDSFIQITDPSSIIFSCYGRTMGKILLSLKQRNVVDTLTLWIPIISKIMYGFVAPQFVHITPQRTIEVIPQLSPLSNEVSLQITRLFVKFVDEFDNLPSKEYVIQLMCNLYQNGFDESFKFTFLAECKPICSHECATPLLKLFLSMACDFNNEQAETVFEILSSIAASHESLANDANVRIASILDIASTENQQKFIKSVENDFDIITLIWNTFLTPDSEKFNQSLYENHIELVISSLRNQLMNSTEDLKILYFLLDSTVPPRQIGGCQSTDRWHLFRFMILLSPLIISTNEDVKMVVQKIMNQIAVAVEQI